MEITILKVNNLEDSASIIKQVGSDKYSVPLMAPKGVFRVLKVKDIDARAANIIKQEMLSLGGEAAVSKDVSSFKRSKSDIVIMGTLRQISGLVSKLSVQVFGLKELSKEIGRCLSNYDKEHFEIKKHKKKIVLGGNPVIMGILNVTPDSFSDGGFYLDDEKAVEHALKMVSDGAGIIDIGGESSRPGAKAVSQVEEKKRVLGVIKKLKKKTNAWISIDTYKPEVAYSALKCGADMINDITALSYSKGKMADVAKRFNAPVVLMHMKGSPLNMQNNPGYKDVVSEIKEFFKERIKFAVKKGIKEENIILDPGIGFGKTLEHNIEILNRLSEFKVFGKPILLGVSRKSFINNIMQGQVPASERIPGSIASALWGFLNGAGIIRAHDVAGTFQAAKVLNHIRCYKAFLK